MGAGTKYTVYLRIPLYRDKDRALAKTNISSYITPSGSEAEGNGTFYIDDAIGTTYHPALALWFIPSWGGNGWSIGWVNDTQNASPTVPKASNGTIGSSLTISLPRVSSSFTHQVSYKFGEANGTISSNAGTSVSWTPPNDLAKQIPNSTSGQCTITVVTKNGSTTVGTRSTTITLSVPSSMTPSITGVTISEANAKVAEIIDDGKFMTVHSRVKVVTSREGSYGSSISRTEVTILGNTYVGQTITTGALNKSGDVTISIKVTDSRGRSTSTTRTISVRWWSPPRIDAFSARRSLATGEIANDGWSGSFDFKFFVHGMSAKNPSSWKIQYLSGSTWTTITSGSGYDVDTSYLSNALFNPDESYKVRLVVTDHFQTSISEFEIPTSYSIIDINSSKRGIAFGKASEKNAFEVAMPAEFTGGLKSNGNNVTETKHLMASGNLGEREVVVREAIPLCEPVRAQMISYSQAKSFGILFIITNYTKTNATGIIIQNGYLARRFSLNPNGYEEKMITES